MRSRHFPLTWLPLTWANLLTLLRLALIPNICYALVTQTWDIALYVFGLASITDMADGWCARYFNEETAFGQYLDPIVDKLLMISCYGMFAFVIHPYIVPAWFFYIILIKEISLLCGGIWLWAKQKRASLVPVFAGKLAMALQVLFLTWVLWSLYCHTLSMSVFTTIMWMITASISVAFVQYAYRVLQRSGVSL